MSTGRVVRWGRCSRRLYKVVICNLAKHTLYIPVKLLDIQSMEKGRVLVVGCSDSSTRVYDSIDRSFRRFNWQYQWFKSRQKGSHGTGIPSYNGLHWFSCQRWRKHRGDCRNHTLNPSKSDGGLYAKHRYPSGQNRSANIGSHKVRDWNLTNVLIGALFSVESVEIVSDILKRYTQVLSVIDVEPIFKTGPAPKLEMITALRKDILPSITILSATVPEVKALLDEAGITTDYPKNMGDVVEMAKTLRSLGPKYVLIKREIFEEIGKTTTLHFVLSGDGEPLIVSSLFENPNSVTGASYSIPRKYSKWDI